MLRSRTSFSTSLEKSPGFGASRRYSVSRGEPANISGVTAGIISTASACMPSLVNAADAATSLRTRLGWRIASCRPMPAPMLNPTTSAWPIFR